MELDWCDREIFNTSYSIFTIILKKITAVQNKVALSYHSADTITSDGMHVLKIIA